MDRKQFLIEKMKLKNIKEKINSISGVSIINVYEHSDICENYIDQLDEIYKIDFPILTKKEIGDERYKYIEYLYKYLKLQTGNYNWLLPNFDISCWWLELKIDNLCNFLDIYYLDNFSVDLTAIDINYKLLFDIGYGESDIEYYIIWL